MYCVVTVVRQSMLTILFVGVALVAVLFYILFVKPMSYWKKRGVRQGEPRWLFGDIWGIFFQLYSFPEMVQHVYKQCPNTRYSGMYQFALPILLVKDPELIKQMCIKDFDHFTDHMEFLAENSDPFWSKGLLNLKGQEWHNMRTLLSPSFTSSKMKAMFVLMTECAENFLKYFLKKDEEILTLEMKDVLTRFTNDVIATTNFGVEVDSLAKPNNEFYLMAKESTNISFWKNFKLLIHIMLPQLFSAKFFPREVTDFFSQLVNETLETREKEGIVRHDIINLFMEARKGAETHEKNSNSDTCFALQDSNLGKEKIPMEISNFDITATALIFLFAGFDSVSGLMCFTFYELAMNPDVQERLRNEIHATLEEGDGKLTYEGLLKMKYMDMVASESLRKWPAFPQNNRVCTKPYIIQPTAPEEKPVHLEKGTSIWFPTFAIHRDPKYYPDPDRFDPDRFSDENKGKINPYTYMPFGIGPRNCIGSRFALLEAKIIFFYVLQNFEIVPVEKTQIPLEMSKNGSIVAAADGFWLGLKRIDK